MCVQRRVFCYSASTEISESFCLCHLLCATPSSGQKCPCPIRNLCLTPEEPERAPYLP